MDSKAPKAKATPVPRAAPPVEAAFERVGLSAREADAARSVLAGMTAAEAGAAMGVGASTVANYRSRAYKKLGVDGQASLLESYGSPTAQGAAPAPPVPDVRERLLARGLNATQADVLALILAGRSTAQIAEELSLAEGTVRSARARGYQVLGVHSRDDIAQALEDGEKHPVAGPESGTGPDPESEPGPEPEPRPSKTQEESQSVGDQKAAPSAPAQNHGLLVALLAVLAVAIATALALYVAFQSDTAKVERGSSDQTAADTAKAGALPETRPSEPVMTGIGADGYPDAAYSAFTAYADDGTVLFGINEYGQRFGTQGWAGRYLGGRLELLAAVDSEFNEGYVYEAELTLDRAPKLYASDGVTVIGEYYGIDGNIDNDYPPGETAFSALDPEGHNLFGANESGQTYGDKGFAHLYLQDHLDLIAATGKGGKSGFVRAEDVDRVWSPGDPTELPVYDKDGATVIDAFALSGTGIE